MEITLHEQMTPNNPSFLARRVFFHAGITDTMLRARLWHLPAVADGLM